MSIESIMNEYADARERWKHANNAGAADYFAKKMREKVAEVEGRIRAAVARRGDRR